MSEVEVLQLAIAEKLSTDPDYSQSTAEYQELVRFTGETSYIAIAKELANQYNISLSSVRRLLRKHGGRLRDES